MSAKKYNDSAVSVVSDEQLERDVKLVRDDRAIEAGPMSAPVPITKPSGKIEIRRGMLLTECPSNIDLTTYRGKQLIMQAANPGDVQFDENGRAELHVTHWLAYPDQGIDPETGEEHEFTRVVFFDRDGRHFKTTAAHALDRLSAAMVLFSKESWEHGIHFVITERRSTKSKNTYHDIRLGDETPV